MTIKELRLEKHLTLAEFAKSLGIGMSTLTGYEAGKRAPSAKTLAAVKAVYGVDLATAEAAPAKKEKKAPAKKAPAKKEAKAEKPAPAKKEAKAEKPAPAKKAAKAEKPAPARKEAKAEKPAPARKAPPKRPAKKAAGPQIIIQSPLGGEITPFAILAKVGEVDRIYIRVDLNKAFWVKGNQTGSVDLW